MSFNSEYQELRKKRKKKETITRSFNPLDISASNNTISQKRYNTESAPIKTSAQQIIAPTITDVTSDKRKSNKENNYKATTAFEDTLTQKYSTMSLEEIEKEYKRVEAEEKAFKKANGGKVMNFLAKIGSYSIGEDVEISGSDVRGKAQSNIDKINDFTKEKEIINKYRKQKASKKYLGSLTKEQIKLVDEIVDKSYLEDHYQLAPVFNPASSGQMAVESAKNKEKINKLKKEIAVQLKKQYKDKSDDEINELIDNIVELRKNQINEQQQKKDNAEMQNFAKEHEVSAFLLSRGANIVGGFTGLFEPLLQAGNEYGIDTNAAGYSLTKASNTIDEQIQLDHDWTIEVGDKKVDGFDFMYSIGTGVVDNVARLALSGGNSAVAGGMMFGQATTQSIIDNKEKGYSDAKALTMSLLNGTFEAITEKLSLDVILKSNGTALKQIANSFIAEGSEEVTSNWLNKIADQIANGNHSELSRQYTLYLENGYTESEALAEVVGSSIGEDFEAFLIGGLSGAVMGGGNAVIKNVSKNTSKNTFTENEQKVIDKEIEKRIAEKEKDGNTVTSKEKSQIRKSVINDLDKGYISIDTIEEALGGDSYKSYKEAIDNENALQEEFNTLNKMKQGEMTGEQIDRRTELKQQLEDLKNNSNTTQLKQQLSDDVFGIAKDSRLAESYNEKSRRGQTFEADLSKYDVKQQEVVKKAMESGILNNTNRTHEFVDMLAKISADKGVPFDFTNNEKLKNSSFAVEGSTVNGYVTAGGITLNIDSAKALNSVVGHEITHILEGTELYNSLQQTIIEYAKSKGDYQGRYDTLSKLYEGVKGANVDNELTADLVGDYLFTDSEFINSLSTEQPNLFKRIYNEIKYLYKVATAGSKEARELEKVKRAFDKAYKESAIAQKNTTDEGGVKYSISRTQNMSWDDQVNGLLKKSGQIKRNDTLVIENSTPMYLQSEEIENLPLAVPISVITKATNGKDVSHSIKKEKIVDLQKGIKNAEYVIKNPDRNSFAFITNIEQNGHPVLVSFLQNTEFDSDRVHKATSIHLQIDVNSMLKSLPKNATIYIKNKNKFNNAVGATNNLRGLSAKVEFIDDILPQNSEKSSGNAKYSLSPAELDKQYLSAVKNNDIATAQKIVDDVAKENGYNSPVLYHGTHSFGFTNFDLDKMDDKRSIFLTSSKNIASTYSGVTGTKNIGNGSENISNMSADELVNALNEYDAKYKSDTTEGAHRYELYDLRKTNNLIDSVNTGIESLKNLVEVKIKNYADKMATDFEEKDAKIHRQLVNLLDKLENYSYDDLSTPIYLLLHYTDVFNGSTEIATLEKNIRLMNQLRRNQDVANGVIVDETLGGYVIELMSIDEAKQHFEKRLKQGNYSLYAKLGKSLVIDGNGALWKDIRHWTSNIEIKPTDVSVVKKDGYYELVNNETNEIIPSGTYAVNSFTDELYLFDKNRLRALMVNKANQILRINTETMNTTREIAKFAQEQGYNSVVFKNIRDNGGMNSDIDYDEVADIYVIFNPNSIKSADAVTYDDNGNVIPLSERFKDDNNDIRYSYSKESKTPKEYGNFNIYGQDIKYQGTEDVAPVQENVAEQETIAPVQTTKQVDVKNATTVIPEDYAPGKAVGKHTEMKNANTGTEEKVAEILTEEPKVKKKKGRALSRFIGNIFDKGAPVERISLERNNRELQGKYNSIRYAESKAQNLIGKGAEGVKALTDIQAEVESEGLTASLYEYLYHKHNVDRMSLESRDASNIAKLHELKLDTLDEKQLYAIAKEKITEKTSEKRANVINAVRDYFAFKGAKNKAVFGDSVTAEMSQAIVDKYERENPKLIEYAEDVYNYNRYLRNLLVENGIISQETADLWEKIYPHYIPIRRVGNEGLNINVPLDTGRTGINAPIKRAKGGNSDILPLFDTIGDRTLQTYKAIAKNRFGVELKNTLGTTIENTATSIDDVIDSIDTQDSLLQEGKNGKNPTFTVFENGEKVTFEITEELYDAMKPTSEGLAYTNPVANKISNAMRGLLTEYNPTFMFTNAVKDAQDVLINSQHPASTYKNFPEAIKQLAKKSGKWFDEYYSEGGIANNTYFEKQTKTFATEKSGFSKVFGFPFEKISEANNFIEQIPRLAEYIASREAGRSVDVAMLDAARVTTNFSAGGDVTKFLNRNGATFLNASVQGAAQQVRNVREAKYNGLKGWVQLATKIALAGLPAMLLNGLLWDDDEDYEELSDYVKDNYYIVAKTQDGKFIRIPKGRATAVIQNAFEQTYNALTGDDEVDLERFLDLAITNLAPNNPVDNNIVAPIIQVANNKTWYGEDLVPTRLQDLPASEQFDESTDEISKWLGETLNISPYKINYLLNQYSGGVGDVVLPMLTPEAESGDNSFFGNLFAPMKDKFTTDSVMKNQNVSDFYATSEKVRVNAKSSTATDEDVLKNKYFNEIQSELGKLYAEKRAIQNSNLNDKNKYQKVRDIQQEINSLAREALNTYENVNINGNYANIGDIHYHLNDKNEWIKVDDKQFEKQEKVTKSLGITPDEYWGNKAEYDFAYESPEKYAMSKAVGGYDAFKTYSSELYDIKADKDKNGKSISGSRKEKVIEYINNLDADYYVKIILFKSEYNADDTYNNEIIDYLNGREDISYEEMVAILKELGFNVDSKGNISW